MSYPNDHVVARAAKSAGSLPSERSYASKQRILKA